MANNKIKKKEGFTIIEVVLVLAIAGLIFLMVFVALPALQSSQRDTQRREDMGRMVTAITNYKSNNRNKLPATGDETTFITNYLADGEGVLTSANGNDAVGTTGNFEDPDGTNYKVKILQYNGRTNDSLPKKLDYTAYLVRGAKCGDTEGTVMKADGGENNYALVFKFEGAGTYCSDDS